MKMMQWINGVALAGGLLLAASGCGRPVAAEPAAAQSATDAPLDRVTAGRPQRKKLQLFSSQPGRIEAFEETPLFPKITAFVENVLVDIGDFSYKDAAQILDIPVGTVMSRLHRGRRVLKHELAERAVGEAR